MKKSVANSKILDNGMCERNVEATDLSHTDAVCCLSLNGHSALDNELNQIRKETRDSHNQGNHSATLEWYNSSGV